MIDITQPKPRNIGLMNTQNTNPTIEAMMIATTLATLYAVEAGDGCFASSI